MEIRLNVRKTLVKAMEAKTVTLAVTKTDQEKIIESVYQTIKGDLRASIYARDGLDVFKGDSGKAHTALSLVANSIALAARQNKIKLIF